MGLQCTRVGERRTIGLHIENQVVAPTSPGEIFLQIIDDMVEANRAQEVLFFRAIHTSHFNTVQFGELHPLVCQHHHLRH